jgi:hypothetical protein
MDKNISHKYKGGSPLSIESVNYMKKALAEVVEEKAIKTVTDDISDNTLKLVSDLQKTIFFSELNLKWSSISRSLISDGDLGINSFEKYR